MKVSYEALAVRSMILDRGMDEIKSMTPRQVEMLLGLYKEINELEQEESETQPPYLQIILEDKNGVPKVFRDGKEIKFKRSIDFEWETDTEVLGGMVFKVDYHMPGNKNSMGVRKIEEERTRGKWGYDGESL